MRKIDIDGLVRPHIHQLRPYSSARDEYSGKEGVFLDANENPIGSVTSEPFNRYPDPHQWAVKEKLAVLKGVMPEMILLGNGSDEVIDLLFRAFCEPGEDFVMLTPPTYGMYQVSADINRVTVREVPLNPDFSLDVEGMVAEMAPANKLTFLCSPNNPTANSLSREAVMTVLEEAPGLVVVDEAYIDFSANPSFIELLGDYHNLVVMQTFSKAWGMAGLRLGMAFAHPRIIGLLNKIKPPYNINQVTQAKALEALEGWGKQQEMVRQILAEREHLAEQLRQLDVVGHVFPSDANFLLVRTKPEAQAVYQYLVDQKIIVRDRSKVALCQGCLRITVGVAEENRGLLAALEKHPK